MKVTEEKPLVSIIIPVYNAEKYLEECLNSIIGQTYSNLEILLIDDGSKDRSGEICDQYAKQDNRIKVHHKPNSGVSRTRNYGLDHCHGEWVVFVDSDDYVEKDYIERFLSYSVDYVVGGYTTFGISNHILKSDKEHHFCFPKDISVVDAKIKTPEINIIYHICSKIYKRQIIEQLHIRFVEDMILAEDCCFNLDYLYGCNDVMVIPYAGYFYRKYQRGVTYKMTLQQYDNYRSVFLNSLRNLETKFGYYFKKLPDNIIGSFWVSYKNNLVIDTGLGQFIKDSFYNKEHKCLTSSNLTYLSKVQRIIVVWSFRFPFLGFFVYRSLRYLRSIRY